MKKKALSAGAAAIAVAVAMGLSGCAQMNRETHVGCTVEDKDRTTNSDGASVHRLYTDCGVFAIKDNLLEGRWDSADDYQAIEVGATYDFETIGWRNGFMSLFPNVVKFDPSVA